MGFIFPYVQHQFVLASLYLILKWLSVSLTWTQAFVLTVQLVLLWGYVIPIENELFHTALILSGLETPHRRGQAYIITSRIVLSHSILHSHCIASLHARLAFSPPLQDWSPRLFTVIWVKGIPHCLLFFLVNESRELHLWEGRNCLWNYKLQIKI